MEEKKYLKWYNKVGYGSGDIAGNVVYVCISHVFCHGLSDGYGWIDRGNCGDADCCLKDF